MTTEASLCLIICFFSVQLRKNTLYFHKSLNIQFEITKLLENWRRVKGKVMFLGRGATKDLLTPLMINDTEHRFMCLSYVYLWTNVYSNPSAIFKVGYLPL